MFAAVVGWEVVVVGIFTPAFLGFPMQQIFEKNYLLPTGFGFLQTLAGFGG